MVCYHQNPIRRTLGLTIINIVGIGYSTYTYNENFDLFLKLRFPLSFCWFDRKYYYSLLF